MSPLELTSLIAVEERPKEERDVKVEKTTSKTVT